MSTPRPPIQTSDPRIEAERFRALVANLGFGVMVEDERRRVSLANRAFCAIFELPVGPEELLGADCEAAARELAPLLSDPDGFVARIEQVLANGAGVAGDRVAMRDGRVLERDYVPIAVDAVGRGHLWVYRDVTRSLRDAELQRAAAVRDELRVAVDTIPGLVWSARRDGYVDFLNQRWCDYTGLSLEEACGSGWEAAIHPDDLPSLRAYWHSLLDAGLPSETEARLRAHDGNYRWFLLRAIPLRDGHGEVVKWYGQSTDIDDRRRAEALLAGEKRLLEMLARGCPLSEVLDTLCRLVEGSAGPCFCSVLLIDGSGRRFQHGAAPSLPGEFSRWFHGRALEPNAGPCALAVSLRAQVISADLTRDSRWDDSGWNALAARHGLRSCWSTPIVSVEQRVLGTFAIYQGEAGDPTQAQLALIEQLTHLASVVIERRRSEEALQAAQAELSHVTRVTTLGELAASIAHEVNQPLAAMVADASACLNWLAAEPRDLDKVRDSLQAIVNDGARAGQVLSRIRALLSRSASAHAPCALEPVFGGALALVRPELQRQRVSVEAALELSGAMVLGDPVELQQVLLNLLLNAGEAARDLAPDGRRVVVVRSSIAELDGRSWVTIAVEDAGTGFDPDDVERLFSAFYTTKPGGLGMGLSIVRSIVERHGGRIWASRNAVHGATFQFSLPLA
jgi:PAS domain S-box-containing protein